MNAESVKDEALKKSKDSDPDYLELAVDVLVPFLLDTYVFKGKKGRVAKVIGTVVVQQLLKTLAKSKAVDDLLDSLEEWLTPEDRKPAKPFPTLNDAVKQTTSKKYWNRSRPEDYYDPEREMYY
ncbi:MAG: hypothetical protein J5I59_01235 [Saprospiraceae bacterium]|nr:hypothetical protein [Saprospiraceae bacterium]